MSDPGLTAYEFIADKVRKAAEEKSLPAEDLSNDFDLFTTGAFDSLGFVSLVTSIEQEFDVELDFSELDPEAFTTLGGLAEVVQAAIGAKS